MRSGEVPAGSCMCVCVCVWERLDSLACVGENEGEVITHFFTLLLFYALVVGKWRWQV
jgi:hypothetical protein